MPFKISGVTKGGGLDFASKEVGGVHYPIVMTDAIAFVAPAMYNIILTTADTEYNQALPANCRFFEFQCLTSFDIRFAFVTDKVATPASPYMTLKSGSYYYSPQIYQGNTPLTLYLASAQAGVVIQLLAWR